MTVLENAENIEISNGKKTEAINRQSWKDRLLSYKRTPGFICCFISWSTEFHILLRISFRGTIPRKMYR